MDNIKEYLYDLYYEKSLSELNKAVKATTDSKLLHMIMANYNWDDGLSVPKNVINNLYCDLGTALMIFDLFGGYEYLIQGEKSVFSKSEKSYLAKLKERIINRDFASSDIKYIPLDLTRTMKYYIRKACHDIDEVFLNGTEGEEIEIIRV